MIVGIPVVGIHRGGDSSCNPTPFNYRNPAMPGVYDGSANLSEKLLPSIYISDNYTDITPAADT